MWIRIIVFCLLIPGTLFCQVNESRLYTSADGLPYTETNSVHVDKQGYLWVLSNNNQLSRYDGRKFTTYDKETSGISYALSAQMISDRYGVWFPGTEYPERLCRYDQGKWYCYSIDSMRVNLDLGKDQLIGYDPRGNIYFFDPDENNWLKEVKVSLPKGIDKNSFGVGKAFSGKGYYLHYTIQNEPVQYFTPTLYDTSLYERVPLTHLPDDPSQRVPKDQILRFIGIRDPQNANLGNLYAVTHAGLVKIQLPNLDSQYGAHVGPSNHFNAYQYLIIQPNRLQDPDLYQIVQFADTLTFKPVATFRSSTPHINFTIDSSGHFWIASHRGLLEVNPEVLTFYEDQPGMIASLHNINEDKYGNIWFGGYGTGMCYFDGQYLQSSIHPPYQRILPGSFHDLQGYMYFFDEQLGLVKYDGLSWEHTGVARRKTGPPPYTTGYFFRQLDDHRLALGLTGAGVALIDSPSVDIFHWNIKGVEQGFGLGNVLSIAEDRDHRLWLGRSSTGIAIYDPTLDTIVNWLITKHPDLRSGFVSSWVDDRGNLWMGKPDGLYFLSDPHTILLVDSSLTKKIKHVPLHGMENEHIAQLYQKDQYLIFGNTLGHGFLDLPSFYANPESPKVYFFFSDRPDQGGASEQNAIYEDTKGNIWLGKDRGAIRLRPDTMTFDDLPVNLVLDSLWAGDEFIPLAAGQRRWRLPLAKRNLQLWTNPSFTGKLVDNVTIRYRMNPTKNTVYQYVFDKDGLIQFTYLPPGTNLMELQAIKNNQVVDQLDLQLVIPRTLLENPWFWILSVGGLVTAIGGYFYNRQQQQLILRHKELELSETRREKEKLQIAAIANSLNPHFINNSLSWVQWALVDNPEGVKVVNRLAENIKTVFKKSREGKPFHTLAEELKLVENYLTIQQIRYGRNFELSIPSTKELQPYEKIHVPLMQIQIHVENAIEHGIRNRPQANRLEINLLDEGENLHIQILDDGIGRPEATRIQSAGTGEGLQMLAKMHAIYNEHNMLHLRSWYEDTPFTQPDGTPYGTIVHLIIPKNYHYDWESI